MGSLYIPVFAKISCISLLSLVVLSLQLLLLSQTFYLSFASSNSTSCLHHQKLALLQLKQGFSILPELYNRRLDSWNLTTDCCTWGGITCDEATGQVIGLDLSRNGIAGQIDSDPISSALGQLTTLTHLDLSSSFLSGQIPLQISILTRLIFLDLSHNSFEIRNPNIITLFGKLSNLRELFLDGVNISGEHDGRWAEALSSALPNLQKLSLASCNLQGPIGTSLFQIPSLSQLKLSGNNLSMIVGPNFLGFSSNLARLSLYSCNLHGNFPESIFLLPNLALFSISNNPYLTFHLPEFPKNSALQYLYMDNTQIKKFTDSIGNLKFLKELSLQSCNLYGLFPSSIGNLSQLEYLDLSFNNFSGTIPSTFGDELQRLTSLKLCYNSLKGSIPSSVFSISSLDFLDLSNNHFIGTIGFHMFENLKNLIYLDLSDNDFSFINNNNNSHLIFSSQIQELYLRSCNISAFPDVLQNLSHLYSLDLSNNKIRGEIPSWTWKLGNWSLRRLNLSNNFLESFEHPLPNFLLSGLNFLDLHSNKLQGPLPVVSSRLIFQDYSSNNFSSIIPNNMNFTFTKFFFLSKNNVSGQIPFSICSASDLQVLDLSNNNFSGSIPTCLYKVASYFKILNLRRNSLHGIIPEIFEKGSRLRTLNLYENELEGPIPRSLANCKDLEVLDLGNNHLNDTFPFWLQNLQNLRILNLRSNMFHGPIAHSYNNPLFPFLQIFDISSNSFMGAVPPNYFLNWKAVREEDDSSMNLNDKIVRYIFDNDGPYYQDSVIMNIKGIYIEVVKILIALKSIDLSNNMFQGEIPKSIGDLRLLRVLNFSQNDFFGLIPMSLENLTLLESLDLSRNKLSGEIPRQLVKLTFLQVLNLSQNLLFGSIPQSQQFLTFTNDSFLGNIGLCGPPLSRSCGDAWATPPSPLNSLDSNEVGEIDWRFLWIGVGIGFGLGFGAVFWTLALWKKGCKRYFQFIDKTFFKFCSFSQ